MSIVRDNLMTRPGYKPYCGNTRCSFDMPRTRYIAKQFHCGCGWRSSFEPEFIAAYEAKWADPAPQTNVAGIDASLMNALVLQNALEMTGCDDEADLIDMAKVGKSLMERIDSLVGMPGSYHGWSPADDPAEIVFDLVNDLDELREEAAKLRAAISAKVSAAYRDEHEKADALLRAALTKEGQDNG